MLKFIGGDLFESRAQTLVNAVNTVGIMGKGIALEFKKRYPGMFEEYRQLCDDGLLDVGELHLYKANDHWILNFPTKYHYRNKSRLEYIRAGLCRLRDNYAEWSITSIAMPALGCGLGGLSWSEVREAIEEYLGDLPIEIEVYEPDTVMRTEDLSPEDVQPVQLRLL